jgi:LmbE family N-acetylglucosaminyl deacetylase
MNQAQERIARNRARPALVSLHRALGRLDSVLTVMNTGAHPDDEQSGLLAAFRFKYGMRVVVACSTRGEGGQNAMGPERTGALAAMRSREMEEAARELDVSIHWMGHGPDDPVHDFGFSKSGVDTLGRWGRDRIIERLVRAYRTERPDIVIPTFLDVPGQHGHHRAMTEAAEVALDLAADPAAFPEHFEEGLTPWQVAKYYLPAWPGGGDTYDDEVPPPETTLVVDAAGRDPATGAAWEEIGEFSRFYHASQGMGHWTAEPPTSWPLHLQRSRHNAPETAISDHLPATLGELASVEGIDAGASSALIRAQQAIDTARAAFPDGARIVPALLEAASQIGIAHEALAGQAKTDHRHRLARKIAEIDAAVLQALGVQVEAWAEPPEAPPGGTAALKVRLVGPEGANIRIKPWAGSGVTVGAPVHDSASLTSFPLTVSEHAPLTGPYPPFYEALGGNGTLSVAIETEIDGHQVFGRYDLEEPFAVLPAQSLVLDPSAIIVPLETSGRRWNIAGHVEGPSASLGLQAPAGWTAEPTGSGVAVAAPADLAAGTYRLDAMLDGHPAYRVERFSYPHIGRVRRAVPSALDVLALDLALPEGARIGYVGGGADRVGLWLPRMGLDVTDLDAADLNGDLSRYTTIVIGLFTVGLRADLRAALPAIHRWVEQGGHLVTLYHRPGDGWNPDTVPLRRLVIGQPSLRWRVTNPAAPVTVLAPDHPLLNGPNRIGPADWAGWNKERGLYFAAEWDEAYTPLIAVSDPGEAPLKGALLSAEIGSGRHTHCAFVLHHQLDHLVPGAFRLMANLVQPARPR